MIHRDLRSVLQLNAAHAWDIFRDRSTLTATITGEWTESEPNGMPMLSAQITGPDAVAAIVNFSQFPMALPSSGPSQLPALDFSDADRTACVWQYAGVWLELWASTAPSAVPSAPARTPVPAGEPTVAERRRLILRPSGRLPFARRTKTPKETPTA